MSHDRAAVFRLDPDALACPYPCYEAYRDAGAAVQEAELGAWVVTGYDDIVSILRRPGLASSDHPTGPQVARQIGGALERATATGVLSPDTAAVFAHPHDRTLFTIDPPDHTRQRRLAQRMFSARQLAAWEPVAAAMVDRVVGALPRRGAIDAVDDLAVPIVAGVIAELLGLPGEADRLKRWSDSIVAVIGNAGATDDAILTMLAARREMTELFTLLLSERRAAPGDDLVSAVAVAGFGDDPDGTLTESERAGLLINLAVAGTESTAKWIASAVGVLAARADLQQAVRTDPGSLVTFLEEVLRLEPPSQGMYRQLRDDVMVGDCPVAGGDELYLVYAAGNRDPRRFDAPGDIRLDRPDPARHLSFGNGIHLCLGAGLARLEARLTVHAALRAWPALAPDPADRVECTPSYLLHAVRHVRIVVH